MPTTRLRTRALADDGFSMVESVVSICILTVGLMALAAVMTRTVVNTTAASFDLIAKDKAFEAIENVFAVRDSHLVDWDLVRNVAGGDGGGIFLDGPQPIHESGADGIVGTADDLAAPVQVIRNPGNNGQLGDDDDEVLSLGVFTRDVEIRRVQPDSDSLRQIRVTITYTVGGTQRRYELLTYVSSFS